MAIISDKLNKILSAVFGKDVRQALHDGLDAINKETESTTSRQDYLDRKYDEQIKNMTLQDPSSAEIVDMRVAPNGKTFEKAGDRLNYFDEQLDTKATKTEVDIERKRIDSFTSLSQGSTTGDAELMDGRVDVNGVVHTNIGTAIRTQIKNINDNLFNEQLKTLSLTFVDGWQKVDGTFASGTNYSHTDVSVKEGETYYITGWNFYENLLYAVLNSDGTVIQKVQASGSGTAQLYENLKVVIPVGGTTLRVNKREPKEHSNFIPTVKKVVQGVKFEELNTNTNLRVDSCVSDISLIKSNVKKHFEDENVNLILTLDDFEQGSFSSTTGDTIENPQAVRLKQTFITRQCKQISLPDGYIVYILYYDQDMQFITRMGPIAEIIQPEVKYGNYIRVFFQKSDYSSFVPNSELVNNVKVTINKMYNTVSYPNKIDEKPLDNIDKTGGYMAIFHNFGVIGDSFASGNMEGVDSTGRYVYKDFLDYAWGKSIERATGCTYHRFSRGGQYLHDDNWYSEWKEKIKTDLCQAYIINIGFNDFNWLEEDPSRYGSIADIKSDYTQNPNTFYGQYAKMIQLIKSVQPKARIFLCNMEWNNTDNSNINTVISDICNYFENCYLIDLYTYAHEPHWNVPNIYKTGVYHKNTLGYQKMAWDVMSYIDYIIRHNMEEFIDVQFIGTDLRLPTKEEVEGQS